MIGATISVVIFLTLFSYNYISKSLSTLLLLETIFCISLGSFLHTIWLINKKRRKKINQTRPAFNNINKTLGFINIPMFLSIFIACLDTTSLYLFTKINYKTSLMPLLNITILIYLIYFCQYNTKTDFCLLLFLANLCFLAVKLVLNEKYPSEKNFTLLIDEYQEVSVIKKIFPFLMFEYILLVVFLTLRYLANWAFKTLFKQQLLIFIMNHIDNSSVFSDFSDFYNQNIPLFDSLSYGLGMTLFLLMFSVIWMELPYNYTYNTSSIVIMTLYSLCVVFLTFILSSVNTTPKKDYDVLINRLKKFVRSTVRDNELELTAKNRGSSFMKSRFILCAFFSTLSLVLSLIICLKKSGRKILGITRIKSFVFFNRLEIHYQQLYIYFAALYFLLALTYSILYSTSVTY
ncbi:hypothetical protein CDIK_1727 [Cucumispora dikerogammari]|nr:hypothetical protein CDIK_1727 [Cucumispora dikerogammari]